MTVNGITMDESSSEYKNWTRMITLFPPSAMLLALHRITESFDEFFDEGEWVYRRKGPFTIMDKIQHVLKQLQNALFADLPTIKLEVKL